MTSSTDAPSGPAVLAARLQAALALHQQGRLAEARPLYEGILRDHPAQPDALHLLGVLALQGGDAATAARLIGEAIAAFPGNPEFHLNQAIALRALGQPEAALACHDRALALNPGLPNAHLGRAALLKSLGRPEEAAASYARALALCPEVAEIHFNLGNLQLDLNRAEAAAASYARAIELKPGFVEAHVNHAEALLQLRQDAAALARVEQALALRPGYAPALVTRGNALLQRQDAPAALASFEQALVQQPGLASALLGVGKARFTLTQDSAALASIEAALAQQPDLAEAWILKGRVLCKLHRGSEALAAYDRAIALQPGLADAWYSKGIELGKQNRAEEALACLEQALRLRPGHALVEGELLTTRMSLCDWTDFDLLRDRLAAAIQGGEMALLPFAMQSLIDSPPLQLRAARLSLQLLSASGALPTAFPPGDPAAKIRLGYFSADFREHPVAQLTAGLFEHHDRSAFEVIGFAFGPPADDAMRQRLEKAFDRLIDVAALNDRQIAELARELGIDIAIDLGGYTHNSRSGIFACRAAPVQVSYIGFLGTMGAPWMDYLVADATLIPVEQRPHYAEKIVSLPWYQANDNERRASDRVFTRTELGLPERGVVLASFNNHYKITPEVYARWMHVLAAVPDSVLYLLVGPDLAREHLRAAARGHGIDPARIVFAERLPRADYLARYRIADLFLDTWPCNAGTTASDALLMGVPVLTCAGQAMISRMAASVLMALEMPELITRSPDDYEQRAIALARDPAQLATLHEKVERQRLTAPLFDIARFTRHLEAAFRAMQARRCAGQAPEHIVIAP